MMRKKVGMRVARNSLPVRSSKAGAIAFWRRRNGAQILFGVTTLTVVLALYTILRFIPIIQTFYYSLFSWRLAAPKGRFILLHNFISLMGDDNFLTAFKNTIVFCFFTTSLTILVSLALSLMIAQGISTSGAYFEFLYFIPVVISMVPVAVVWKWIYDPNFGLLNYLVSIIGISKKAWLLDPFLVMPSVIVMSVWKALGFHLVIFNVGLKSIPVEYYDAAAIDGINWWTGFRYITLPLLRPIMLFALVWATIQNLNVFTQIYILTMGFGATGTFGRPVPVIVFDIYNNAFKFTRMGYASAEAVVLFVVVLLISLIQLRLMRESL